ncbi:hypothetical protein A4D02_29180 [Niastella koreensis]|uniref:GLUG domain-containing protein n=2 Tax=Niastella koreensis TaxID=354356 RepID=G8TRA5_NIAKG|nr:GLUG motif-containing protein [Niastella koreensis]AEW00027.1 hypothetical protein Niako_3730 [Niastella koreensis GR20-10]OQP49662.1 hypothetical protein A4D02_29180 [Niastella koreensis]
MFHTLSKIGFPLLLAAVLFGCKKSSEGGGAAFQSLTFKFGADSTAITIDNAVQEIKNMPRSCDVTKLAAAAVLPAGFSISPDPSTVTDYTKGVTYTVKTGDGKTYTVQITAPVYDPVNNPYGIYTAKQLNNVRNGLNDSYVLMNDIELPALTTAGSASVGIADYKDYGWYSIGTRYVNGGHVIFRGSLDGQNHVIKNLTCLYRDNSQPTGIDAGHNGKSNSGLFGYAIHSAFKNIGIQLAATGINEMSQDGSAGLGYVGSLVGYADSCTITNCYVTGTATLSASQYTGGLLGTAQNTTISKCYAAITAPAGSYAISASTAGGLIGTSYISDISDSYATGSVTGGVDVGGLIGTLNASTLKNSYASGNVTELPMNTAGSLIAPNNIGGLVGTLNASSTVACKIQNCYATGNATGANGSNTDFHKSTRIGGLVGTIGAGGGVMQVTNCYATGLVSRININATAPFLIGALVGNTPNGIFITSGTCTNYWDKTTTGQTVLGGGNGNLAFDNANTANGKTTAEMKASATYANWDFSAVWNVASGTNNGYPYLRSTTK